MCRGAAGEICGREESRGGRSLARETGPAFRRSGRPAGVPPGAAGVLQGAAGGPQRPDTAQTAGQLGTVSSGNREQGMLRQRERYSASPQSS